MRTLALLGATLSLVLGLLTGGSVAAAPVSDREATSSVLQRSPASTYAAQAFRVTNRHRVKRDRVRLKHSKCLHRKAVRQARKMARQRRIFHQDLRPVLRDCNMRLVGENVAYGYRSGKAVVNRGWMKSPGHRRNILTRQYRRMGIAARKAGGRWYVAQVFGRRA